MRTIDWHNIAYEFAQVRALADEIPTDDEIDAYKASLQAPELVKSVLRTQLEWGKLPAPTGESRASMVDYALSVLAGRPVDESVPKHIAGYFENHLAVVESAIAERSLSLDFVHSWGKLQEAAGILNALLISDEATVKSFWGGSKPRG